MSERDEIIEELRHLIRYYRQASHEFFDDTSNELNERLESFYGCLKEDQNSIAEYRKMVDFLVTFQGSLKKKVEDLVYLTDRMQHLLKTP